MEKFKPAKLLDFGGDLKKRWCVDYYYLHPETSKYQKFRLWISARLLTRQARYLKGRELVNKMNARLRQGFNPFATDNSGKCLPEALQEVLLLKQATTGPRNYADLKGTVARFCAWLSSQGIDQVRPAELSKSTATAFLDEVLRAGIGNRTYNNHLYRLRTLFNVLMDREYCEFNVWQKIPALARREADISFITDDERAVIRERLPKDHPALYAVGLLVYQCYLRPAEICRLRVSDVDLKAGTIMVRATQAKNGTNQVVLFGKELARCFAAMHLHRRPPAHYIFASGCQLVPAATPITSRKICDAWRYWVKFRYGIKKGIYDLKGTGVARAFDNGAHARDIQRQLRHHSLDQTQDYLDKVSRRAGLAFLAKMPEF